MSSGVVVWKTNRGTGQISNIDLIPTDNNTFLTDKIASAYNLKKNNFAFKLP